MKTRILLAALFASNRTFMGNEAPLSSDATLNAESSNEAARQPT